LNGLARLWCWLCHAARPEWLGRVTVGVVAAVRPSRASLRRIPYRRLQSRPRTCRPCCSSARPPRRTGCSLIEPPGSRGRSAVGPSPARGDRGAALVAARGRRAVDQVAGGVAAGCDERAALDSTVGYMSRLLQRSRPAFGPRLSHLLAVSGEKARQTRVLPGHIPVSQAELLQTLYLGVKGPQVQILSSRRRDGRFLALQEAAHHCIYQQKRLPSAISSGSVVDLCSTCPLWSLGGKQERIWSGVPRL
jgi:hypothetical protein